MSFAIEPGPLGPALEQAFKRLEKHRFLDALWNRRLDVWTTDAALQRKIGDRLGWLDVVRLMQAHVPRLRAFADEVRQAGFTDVVLLGMGGSSLVSEVLRAAVGVAPGYPRFRVLDSVDPDAVRTAMQQSATTLFILASKSGSTIELAALAAEAERRVRAAGRPEPGSQFVAITDNDTPLASRAVRDRFRALFINPSDIGGRFSALSLFGLVPAAAMGIDTEALLTSGQEMAERCRIDDATRNPGLALGAILATAGLAGRDKLTLVMPSRIDRFGLWAEQLVAESTGKQGKGLVPIFGEAGDRWRADDRIAVAITASDADEVGLLARARTGHVPIAILHMPDVTTLGAEFFRWELATATAGWLLDINPFDEPNVQQAKDATRALLGTFETTGHLPMPDPDALVEGARITLTSAARTALGDGVRPGLTRLLRPGDYFVVLGFLPPDDGRFSAALEHVRSEVADRTACATMSGFGPRYLHSTGQLHKGGPNTGAFLIVTAATPDDLPVPGERYAFGVLEMAQAVGDFQSLERTGRRAVHLHLPCRDPALLQRVTAQLL